MLTNVRDKLSTFAHTCPQLNARQMFIHSRGFQHCGPLPPPPQCSEEAPADPNGFSDGGLFSPSNPQWTYGSHGIHWPTESPEEPNVDERRYSKSKSDSAGLDMWGPVPGIDCSSSRSELFALILALYRPGGIHVALDNKHVVDTSNLLLQFLAGQLAFIPCSFDSMSDGDLWATFFHNAAVRGSQSIKVTWVKGHATELDIEKGVSNAKLKKCNAASDTNATCGLTQHENMLHDIASYFVNRQRRYTKFMQRIVGSNVQVFKAIQTARKDLDKESYPFGTPRLVKIANKLFYPSPQLGNELVINPFTKDQYSGLGESDKSLLTFLFTQRWALATSEMQGMTWIECLILFFLHGGNEQLIGLPDAFDCQSKSSLRLLLNTFTKNMRRLISNFLPEESHIFFKPSKAAQPRLKSIGFSNACAAMCGNVTNLTSEQKQAVSKVLVGFRHTFTRKSSLTWNQGSLMLKPVQFTFRSCLTVTYNKLFAKLDSQASDVFFTTLADDPIQAQPTVFNLVCPACKVIKNAANIKLRTEATWKSIKCSTCMKYRTSRQRLCTCNHPWHSCPIHAIIGHVCGSVSSALRAQKVSSKVSLSSGTFTSGSNHPLPSHLGRPPRGKGPDNDKKRMLNTDHDKRGKQVDSKRARLTPETGIPSSFLPAILAQRFKASVNNTIREPTSLFSGSSSSLSF